LDITWKVQILKDSTPTNYRADLEFPGVDGVFQGQQGHLDIAEQRLQASCAVKAHFLAFITFYICTCQTGLPDFSWYSIPKWGKYTIKYTKWPQHLLNGHKIDQMAIKYTNIFHCKTIQNFTVTTELVQMQIQLWHWKKTSCFAKPCSAKGQ
jgi:hypothetical protein